MNTTKALWAFAAAAFFAVSCNDNAASKIKSEGGDVAPANNMSNQAANDLSGGESMPAINAEDAPVFSFETENHDFGTITEGEMAKHDFVFTNTGKSPLIITNASGSCGCTVPEWPREPIAPGETGRIHVEFNSNNRTGNQTKTVTLSANTVPNKKVLRISAMVNPKANNQETNQEG